MNRTNKNIAKILHKNNLRQFRAIKPTEGASWDDLAKDMTCPECGKPMEVDLWRNIVCGFCGGWRIDNG